MMHSDKITVTRREALKSGLAAAAASGALIGGTRLAFADDTLAEIKKRGELVDRDRNAVSALRYLRQRRLQGRRPRPDRRGRQGDRRQGLISRSALDKRAARTGGEEVRSLHRAGHHHQGAHETLRLPGADRRRHRRADEARQRRQHHEARGHRRQDGRRPEGHVAGRAAQGFRRQTAEAGRGQGICRQQPVLRRSRGRPHRRVGQFAARTSPMRPRSAPTLSRWCLPPFGQPTYFSWVGAARRQDADRRGQRRDPQGRGGRDDGEDPEEMVRPDHRSAEDRARTAI